MAGELCDEEILLRPWSDVDTDRYGASTRDDAVRHYTTERATLTREQAVDAIAAQRADPHSTGFLIADARTGGRLGDIALQHDRGTGAVSYWVATDSRAKDVAARALTLLAGWAFSELHLERITLWTHADDAASRAAAERAGFSRDPDADVIRSVEGRDRPTVGYQLRHDAGRRDRSRLARWEQRTEWPLATAAALFLAAYAWPILDTGLAQAWREVCRVVVAMAWAAFIADYIVRVHLAADRPRYVWRHLPDLAILALPALRPLRLLRVVMLLRVLNRGATAGLRGRIAVYVCGATGILLFCSALTVLDAERPQRGANITGFGEALWWAVTTITTVGYGDHYPVTATGRWVAAGLMLGGIALLGVVTASIASWLIDRVRETEEDVQAATRADVRALTAEVAQLRTEVAALRYGGRG